MDLPERKISKRVANEIIINGIKRNNYTMTDDDPPRRIYTENSADPNNFIKIITSNSDTNPHVITAIRNNPIDEYFSYSALQTIEDEDLDKNFILELVKNEKKEKFDDDRLLFKWNNISVITTKNKKKILSIRVAYPETDDDDLSLRSTISQPLMTHDIDWASEGCALQRSGVPEDKWEEVDCGRCAMSYAGIGTYKARSLLQNYCVTNSGLLDEELDKWLFEYARRPKDITLKEWKDISPRCYSIHNHLIRKYDSLPFLAAKVVCDKLLGRGELCIGNWKLWKSMGHIFNIAKKFDSDIVWYVDPQNEINPGEITLNRQLDKIKRKNEHTGHYLWDVALILTPYQASKLVDEDGTPMVFLRPKEKLKIKF